MIDGAISGIVTSETNPSGPTDPSFSNVNLLLHGDGPDGSGNNVFVDSSGNGKPVTRFGDVTQGGLSPVSGGSSAYFDGAGDYLGLEAGILTGTGNFTIDGWAKFDSLYNYQVITITQSSNTA